MVIAAYVQQALACTDTCDSWLSAAMMEKAMQVADSGIDAFETVATQRAAIQVEAAPGYVCRSCGHRCEESQYQAWDGVCPNAFCHHAALEPETPS